MPMFFPCEHDGLLVPTMAFRVVVSFHRLAVEIDCPSRIIHHRHRGVEAVGMIEVMIDEKFA